MANLYICSEGKKLGFIILALCIQLAHTCSCHLQAHVTSPSYKNTNTTNINAYDQAICYANWQWLFSLSGGSICHRYGHKYHAGLNSLIQHLLNYGHQARASSAFCCLKPFCLKYGLQHFSALGFGNSCPF